MFLILGREPCCKPTPHSSCQYMLSYFAAGKQSMCCRQDVKRMDEILEEEHRQHRSIDVGE